MSDTTIVPSDTQAIVNTAIAAVEPHPLDEDGRFFAVTQPAGATTKVIDLEESLERFRDRPRRKTGSYVVHDVPSFAAYFEKHKVPETEVWGDVIAQTLCAVLNAHTTDPDAGFEDHRLSYAVKKTDAWKAWTGIDGQLLDQVAFAEHIEARAIDFVDPSSAQMLEIAQTFEAKTNVEFQSGQILASGERKLTYKETVNAKAGETGHVEIPKEIALQLVPFEGAAAYKVIARFRYRIANGRLALGVVLERPEDIIRAAFLDVVDSVEEAIQHTVLRGSGGAK
jgi:uncharacterized protein YfdQ (DUF2303 family)